MYINGPVDLKKKKTFNAEFLHIVALSIESILMSQVSGSEELTLRSGFTLVIDVSHGSVAVINFATVSNSHLSLHLLTILGGSTIVLVINTDTEEKKPLNAAIYVGARHRFFC